MFCDSTFYNLFLTKPSNLCPLTRLLPFYLPLHGNTSIFGAFVFFYSTAMAEAANLWEPPSSSDGPIQSDRIQCSSCGRWESSDQFKSRAKGRHSHTKYTKTCLRCRQSKVRTSLVCRILEKLLTSIASKSGRTTISETCEDCWPFSC